MCVLNLKSLSVTLLLLLLLSAVKMSLQLPFSRNYTQSLLRQAKAAEISAYLDTNFGFCDDFYSFACGRWKDSHPATRNHSKTSYLGQIQELYERKSIEMLKTDRRAERLSHEKLKHFFESCSNEVALARSGLEPVLKVVNFRGGWPRITSPDWYEYEYDWLGTVSDLRRRLGVDIFVGLEIVPDFEDKDINRIKIGAPKLALGSRAAYLESSYADEREEFMDNIAKKLRKYFPYMHTNWSYDVAKQILHIERELAKGLPDNPALTIQQTTRKRYASELKAAYGNYVDLSGYLMHVFNQSIQVIVYETPEDYMSTLVDVIKQTPKLTMANYTMWRVLEAFDFAGAINDEHNDIWCVQRIMEYFPKQLEDMFHSHFNSIPLHNELLEVWKDVKTTFQEDLKSSQHLNWMTHETRLKAIQKLEQMNLKVEENDHNVLEYQMMALNFDKYKYYDNLLQILQWHTEHKLAELTKRPHNEPEHEYELPTYEANKNQVTVPIIFLQSRFLWDAAHPHALKYSTLGVLLAQQMLHGFDEAGRRYDKYGNQRGWWDSVSEAAYDKRVECLINQYENLKFRQQRVFDEDMITNVITFNGALNIAYQTYQKWRTNRPESTLKSQETLPKLYYEPQQLFFVGFSQFFCADYDEHLTEFSELPEHLRVNGALANLADFANEVSCKSNAKMNPTTKCNIY